MDARLPGLRNWFSGLYVMFLFVGIVATIITITAVLLNPSDWKVSSSQWWGIFTSHFVNWHGYYEGNMIGLLTFAILFALARAMGVGEFYARLPLIILGSAFLYSFLEWGTYVVVGTGGAMGTSVIISATFGAGLYVLATARSKDKSAKWVSVVVLGAFFFITYIIFGEPTGLLAHVAGFVLGAMFTGVSLKYWHAGSR